MGLFSMKICATVTVAACALFLLFTSKIISNSITPRFADRNMVNDTHAQPTPTNVISLPFEDDKTSDAITNLTTKVLIVTYMRSGSTFTGAMFDWHPDVMYIFEPLWAVQWVFMNQIFPSNMFWQKGNLRNRDPDAEQSLKDSILGGYLNCTFRDVYLESLASNMHSLESKASTFNACRNRHPGVLGLLRCLRVLNQACRESRALVIKTIRYSLAATRTLMEKDPRLKVIHLLRDPRATLESHRKYGHFSASGEARMQYFQTFCQRVLGDLVTGEILSRTFPGRVMRVRYEEIAGNPAVYAQKLLRFAGLEMFPEEKRRLREFTSSALVNTSAGVMLHKTNSSAKVSHWRESISFKLSSEVDSFCQQVYRQAGYRSLDDEGMLRNLSEPAMEPASEVPRMLV